VAVIVIIIKLKELCQHTKAPRILNFGTGWRWMVKFTIWPLYPRIKRRLYPSDRRPGESQSGCGHSVAKLKILPLSGKEPRSSSRKLRNAAHLFTLLSYLFWWNNSCPIIAFGLESQCFRKILGDIITKGTFYWAEGHICHYIYEPLWPRKSVIFGAHCQ
jgi:hypothetical protein